MAILTTKWSFERSLMYFLLYLFILVSCSTSPVNERWQSFEGRLQGIPIYRAKVPEHWQVILPETVAYLKDTTLPIFTCRTSDEEITIAIHNFPTQSITESIPAEMQLQRWYNQFQEIEPNSLNTLEIAYGGFAGYLFEATGTIKNQPMSVLAFAMQVIPEHYRMLQNHPSKEAEFRQMRADYTIKATGSKESMAKHRDDILLFAESFELIKPIPQRL